VAIVARFHRGAIPNARNQVVQALAVDQKKIAIHLSGILRFANVLDGTAGRIGQLHLEQNNGALIVYASGYSPWTRSAEDMAGASHLLQLVIRKPILLKPLKPGRPRRRSLRKQ
jgi:hypothetical protein